MGVLVVGARSISERDKIINGIRHMLLVRWFSTGRNLSGLVDAARIQPEHALALSIGSENASDIDLASLCRVARCLGVDLYTLFTGGESEPSFVASAQSPEASRAFAH